MNSVLGAAITKVFVQKSGWGKHPKGSTQPTGNGERQINPGDERAESALNINLQCQLLALWAEGAVV